MNEEKANELAILYTRDINDDGVEVYNVFAEAALLEMAQWKDEQHAKEKQEWIEEAYRWIVCNKYMYENEYQMGIDFKKAMEES